MVLELKSRKIGVSAVKQIRRYVEDLKNKELKKKQMEKNSNNS